MFATLRRYRAEPRELDEIKRRIEDGFVPLIRGARGFVGYYVVDSGNGLLTTISIFTDRSGAEESTRLAADWVKQSLGDFTLSAPEVTTGEVFVHESASQRELLMAA